MNISCNEILKEQQSFEKRKKLFLTPHQGALWSKSRHRDLDVVVQIDCWFPIQKKLINSAV